MAKGASPLFLYTVPRTCYLIFRNFHGICLFLKPLNLCTCSYMVQQITKERKKNEKQNRKPVLYFSEPSSTALVHYWVAN